MVMKRQLGEGEELPKKGPRLSTKFKGVISGRCLQDYVPTLEPTIRKLVKEEVDRAINVLLRSSDGQIESSRSRTLQLQFVNNLPHTVFTGNRIVSEDKSPMKLALYDSASRNIVTAGPYSTMKVDVIVLDADFAPTCGEDWSEKDFHTKVVQNRQGKRPLLTGESTVSFKDGIGYIRDVCFTDNSSWTRSGRFRLGVKVRSSFDEANIKEGISNGFKVKDHRGESYQKHYPPSLDDKVWRLVKIAKDGASHKRLAQIGISCVRDFLRSYNINQLSLRAVLHKVSDKKWEAIIKHATTCILDDNKYIYTSAEGTGLLFNSIYEVVGVSFDGQSYHPLHSLDVYQMKMVEDLKQRAYRNSNSWEEQDNRSFEIGESSQMQGLSIPFNSSFGTSDASGRFDIGEHTWASIGSQISPQDFTVDEKF